MEVETSPTAVEALETAWEAGAVLAAVRLGWAIAELRGRLRRGPPPDAAEPGAPRGVHTLPLAGERSWGEQTIETECVARTLAAELEVDVPLSELSKQRGRGQAVSDRLTELALVLSRARAAGDAAATKSTWAAISELFYAWDAKIQDSLAADSFAVASGYQLGRALAETYWALDPALPEGRPESWSFLLGSPRATTIGHLLGRLSGFFLPLTPGAVAASVRAWSQVAADEALRRMPATADALHDQIRVWHDLLLTGQPPQSLLPRESVLKRARRVRPVLRVFLPEFAVGLASMIAAALAAALFLGGGGKVRWLAGVLAVLGFFGITGSGALASVKGQAHALFGQLQLALSIDAIKEAVTLPPALPFLDDRKPAGPAGGHQRWL
ncbi:MAG: hypothetical protein ACXVZO_07675 [Gaiellaceae bacterium]